MVGWVPDIIDMMIYAAGKHNKKRREAMMEEASQEIVVNAIEIFKDRYGIREPLDLFRMDTIITELKQEARKTKRKKGNK